MNKAGAAESYHQLVVIFLLTHFSSSSVMQHAKTRLFSLKWDSELNIALLNQFSDALYTVVLSHSVTLLKIPEICIS